MILLLTALIFVESQVFLYRTDKQSFDTNHFDCVFVQSSSLWYCRRPTEEIDREDDPGQSCVKNGGELYRFSELRSKNISTNTLQHRWTTINLEQVEEYSLYLRDLRLEDGHLCRCLHLGAFGMNCEYQLPFGETFEETLRWQLMMRARQENEQKVQMYGDVVCYETLECESGLLCLDWREICDGIQNCLEGKDEENCDRLEMNQCDEEEEYRCTNGMCIPEEFFLDGDLDCFDWSDEMSFRNSNGCPWESVSTECDDHLGEVNQCSCGDGQFIDDRLNFQKSAAGVTCSSGRDQYFFCETHLTETRWTMANGRYHRGRGYQASTVANRSDEEQCEYLLRCALSAGGEIDCPCKNVSSCGAKLVNGCRLPLIPYPRGPVVTPYTFFFVNRTRDWQNRLPDWMLINGTVRCRNSLVNVSKWIPFDINLNVRQMIEEHFCRSSLSMNFSSDQPCHHSNQSTDRCDEWNRCFSRTRINDGWKNCLNGRDEGKEREMEISKNVKGGGSVPKIKRDVDEDNVFVEDRYVIMSGTVQMQRTSTPL